MESVVAALPEIATVMFLVLSSCTVDVTLTTVLAESTLAWMVLLVRMKWPVRDRRTAAARASTMYAITCCLAARRLFLFFIVPSFGSPIFIISPATTMTTSSSWTVKPRRLRNLGRSQGERERRSSGRPARTNPAYHREATRWAKTRLDDRRALGPPCT